MTDLPPADRHQRLRVMFSAELAHADGSTSRHRVLNISETGICLGQAGSIVPGSAVTLAVGAVEDVAADIVWVQGDSAGLSLREPIDVEAARRRPTASTKGPSAGWMIDIGDAYRRR